MKLVYVLTTGGGLAGTEKTFADQTAAMSERGHDVTMVSVYRTAEEGFDFGPRTEIVHLTDLEGPDDIPSLVIPEEWESQFCRRADDALLEYFRTCTADIVVTSTPALMVYAMLGLPPQVKVVTQEHRATQTRGILAEPLMRHGMDADAVVTLTERNAQWLHEQWGERAPRLEVIPNSLPATGRPASGGRQKIVMGAGRFVPSKGFGDLIRAFARVSGEFPDWRLRLFGDGQQRSRLVTTARNLGIADKVEFMGPTKDIEREWARASIGALSSRVEGLPLVLLEARGAGIPVVANDCETGPREIIEHGKDGYLVDVGDVNGFADCLRLLMGDEARRDEMGAHASISLERFRPSKVADQWSEFFDEVMREPLTARQQRAVASAAPGPAAEAVEGQVASRTQGEEESGARTTGAQEVEETFAVRVVAAQDLVPSLLRERNREALEDMFRDLDVCSRPLQSAPDRWAWAVRTRDRERVLDRFAELEDPSLEARLYASSARLDSDGSSWCREPAQVDRDDVTRIYAFRHHATEGGAHIGYAAGLFIEFWDEHESREGLWSAPRRNLEVDLLRGEQFDRPLFSRWQPMRGRPLWSVPDFPVDAVYMWVDGADPAWRARKAEYSGTGIQVPDLSAGDIRFRNRDELRYSLRSVQMHAPWIRRIYLVTDSQRPEWLVEDDRLRVIDHRELFPDPEVLPVFNSQAIESVLHRIPDLAEQFLVMNDDGFFLREQQPIQYFSPTGRPKFFPSPTKINDLGDAAEPHEASGANNRRLLEEKLGVSITQGMLHTPLPHRRSYVASVAERYSAKVEATRRAKFRSDSDVSLLSSLTQYSGYLEGEYELGALRVSFISLGAPQSDVRLAQIGAGSVDFLSFGEAEEDADPEYTQEMALNFMRGKFPIPSPWERR
ncbi:Stealth CR1 domain-containing protein [Brachybacterium vulturis]|uniref:Stealth CR1 domain-containing protein n=1 Tax=Brachybacterium vulturis TaxID=2017484 RepID=UPI0037358ACB